MLALLAVACMPGHRMGHHGPGMGMPCGRTACTYKSKCFSEGAIRSSDGVCQACNEGKWVSASGCREPVCHEHGGKMEKPHHRSEH
jgi:hypothetical protein